jgi:hypothetical protein
VTRILCQWFSEHGYTCKTNHPLRERDIKFIPDVMCEKDGERVIVESYYDTLSSYQEKIAKLALESYILENIVYSFPEFFGLQCEFV